MIIAKQSLAVKYRPKTWEDVSEQEEISGMFVTHFPFLRIDLQTNYGDYQSNNDGRTGRSLLCPHSGDGSEASDSA